MPRPKRLLPASLVIDVIDVVVAGVAAAIAVALKRRH